MINTPPPVTGLIVPVAIVLPGDEPAPYTVEGVVVGSAWRHYRVARVDRRGCRIEPNVRERGVFIRWATGRSREVNGLEHVLHPVVTSWCRVWMGLDPLEPDFVGRGPLVRGLFAGYPR